MNRLAAVHTLGGCGGTLLSRLLAALADTVVLSETNPASALLFELRLNPFTQIREWYPSLFERFGTTYAATDMAEPALFSQFVSDLAGEAGRRGCRVVIRDYNYVDYCGVPFATPYRRSSLLSALSNSFEIRSVVVVRHPLRQYLSLRSHEILRPVLTPEVFLEGYSAFLRDFGDCPLFTYEDLTAVPGSTLEAMCSVLGLSYSSSALDDFTKERAVTGNLNRLDESTIAPSERALPDDEMSLALQQDARYRTLLKRLHYA